MTTPATISAPKPVSESVDAKPTPKIASRIDATTVMIMPSMIAAPARDHQPAST